MQSLTDRPHEVITILENTSALDVITQCGLADLLHRESDRLTKGALAGNLSMAMYDDHPSHWILARLYSHYPKPADNGYSVECFPKSRTTKEQFYAHCRTQAPDNVINTQRGYLAPPFN